MTEPFRTNRGTDFDFIIVGGGTAGMRPAPQVC